MASENEIALAARIMGRSGRGEVRNASIPQKDTMTEEREEDTMTEALAPAPVQAQPVSSKEWDGLGKPLSKEMAAIQTADQMLKRQEKVGAFIKFYHGMVRDWIKAYEAEIRDFARRLRKGEIAIPNHPGVKRGIPYIYGFSYSYLCEIFRGGKKKLTDGAKEGKEGEGETPEETGGADAVSEAIPLPNTVGGWKEWLLAQGHDTVMMVLEASQEAAREIHEEEAKKARESSAKADNMERQTKALAETLAKSKRGEAAKKANETRKQREKEKQERALARLKEMLDAAPHGAVKDYNAAKELGVSLQNAVALRRLGGSQGLWVDVKGAIMTPARKAEDDKADAEWVESHNRELREIHPPYGEALDAFQAARGARPALSGAG